MSFSCEKAPYVLSMSCDLRFLGLGLNGQRGGSSATQPERADSGVGGTTPAGEGPTPAVMLAEIIDSRNIERLSLISKAESFIREIIVHMGTPTVTSRLVDFLMEVECAKRYHLSDRSRDPRDFLAELVRPDIPLRFCSDPGVLKGNTGPNFGSHCRAMADLVDLLMDRFGQQQSHPTYCFLWDVQITVATIICCLED